MRNYVQVLGDVVKRARGKLGFSQHQVADAADLDVRTLLNIENNRGNPKFEVLVRLVRTLKIEPNDIFYPEIMQPSVSDTELQVILASCNEYEIRVLTTVCKNVLDAMRSKNKIHIE